MRYELFVALDAQCLNQRLACGIGFLFMKVQFFIVQLREKMLCRVVFSHLFCTRDNETGAKWSEETGKRHISLHNT